MKGTTLVANDALKMLDGDDALEVAIHEFVPWLTAFADLRDVSRDKPKPRSLSEDRCAEVGLARATWKLEILSDAEPPATLDTSLFLRS